MSLIGAALLSYLQGFSDDQIRGFMIYARSIDSCPQVETETQAHSDILSSEQLNAISLLKDYPYPLIVSWRSSALPTYTSGHAPLPVVAPQVTCWCTYCPQPRRFETKDGWARHEREKHEKHAYPCMPNGAIESTAQGPKCAICQMVNPDEDHLNLHQVASCLEPSLSTTVYKRRSDLVNHLKTHGVSQGRDLAEKWKCTPKKKAWACGFCVKYFQQRMDRINHIFTDHYAHGVDIRSWDHGKVIQGLLHQPPLWDIWSKLLSSKYPYALPEVAWSASVAKPLKTRLEMGEESPEILVAAVYQQSNLGLRFLGNDLAFFGADTASAMNTGQGPRCNHQLNDSPPTRMMDFLTGGSHPVFNDEMWNES